jgi:hypothetical protein
MTPTQPEAMDRLRRGFAEFGSELDLGRDCATHSAIWDAVTGQADPVMVRRLVLHMATCPLCAESWRAAREVAREGGLLPQVDQPVGPSSRWMTWALPAAAAVVMAVAGWLALRAVSPLPETPATTVTRVAATPPAAGPEAPTGPAPAGTAAPAAPLAAPELRPEKAPLRLSTSLLVTMRGEASDDTFLVEFGKAIDPYKRDDFTAAADALSALQARYPKVPEVAFYRGVSLLMAGRAADAMTPLAASIEAADDELAGDAKWYLVVAKAQTGARAEALQAARELCDAPASPDLERRACRAVDVLAGTAVR